MALAYIGNLTLAHAMPGAAAVQLAGVNGIRAAIDDILARIQALRDWRPQPISLDVQLNLAQQLVLMLEQQIQLGVTPPNILQQIAQVQQMLADLLAALNNIQINLDLCAGFGGLLAAAGVHCYVYSGAANGVGAAFTTALASGFPVDGNGLTNCNAVFLGTTIGASWSAMSQIFQVT